MKRFVVAVLLGLLMIWAFDYQSETESSGDRVEMKDNYSIILESSASWGSIQIDPYVYVSGSDVIMRIYNPVSEVVYETEISQGKMFDAFLTFDAQKGPWMIELNAEEATVTYEASLKGLYFTSFKQTMPIRYQALRLLGLFFIVFGILAFCPLRAMYQFKRVINKDHDADGLIALSEKLQSECVSNRLKNVYSIYIATGHIYNGDYFEAKDRLEAIPTDGNGEIKVPKKWLKLFYASYIGLLIELDELEEAEDLLERKNELMLTSTPYPNDVFFSTYLKAFLKVKRGAYHQAKDQLLALKGVAKGDYEKACVWYGLAKVHYQMNDLINAKAYADIARNYAYFKGIESKLDDLEDKMI